MKQAVVRQVAIVGTAAVLTFAIGLGVVLTRTDSDALDEQAVVTTQQENSDVAAGVEVDVNSEVPELVAAWDLSIPSADQFPPGVDLATTPAFFSGGPDSGDVVAAYFADRLGKSLSPEIAYTVEETGGDSALFRWEGAHSEHPSGHFGGWIYLRRESDAWGVIAVTTDGVDMSGLQRDESFMIAVMSIESRRYYLFLELLDEAGEMIPEVDLSPQTAPPTGSRASYVGGPFLAVNQIVHSPFVVARLLVFDGSLSFGEVTLIGVSEVAIPVLTRIDNRRDRNVVVFIDTTSEVNEVVDAIEALELTTATRLLDEPTSRAIKAVDASGTVNVFTNIQITGDYVALLVELKEGSTVFAIREAIADIGDIAGIYGATRASISPNSSWSAPGDEWADPPGEDIPVGPVVIPDIEGLLALNPNRMVFLGNAETVLVRENGEWTELDLGESVQYTWVLGDGLWMSGSDGLISLDPDVDNCEIPENRERWGHRFIDGDGSRLVLVLRYLDGKILYDCVTGIETPYDPREEVDGQWQETLVLPSGVFTIDGGAEGQVDIFYDGENLMGDDSGLGYSFSVDSRTLAFGSYSLGNVHFTDAIKVVDLQGRLLGTWEFEDYVEDFWLVDGVVVAKLASIDFEVGFEMTTVGYVQIDIDSGEMTPFAMPSELLFIN